MKKKILIAEDDKPIVKMLRMRLESNGYEVDEADDGQEALDKITKGSYDLVILDYMMPKMNGDEVLRHVRKNKNYLGLPIIVSTAYRTRDVSFFEDIGATDVIYKPTEGKNLLEMIRKYLSVS